MFRACSVCSSGSGSGSGSAIAAAAAAANAVGLLTAATLYACSLSVVVVVYIASNHFGV
jgi:hypothetical protein